MNRKLSPAERAARTTARQAVVHTANAIKLRRPRGWPVMTSSGRRRVVNRTGFSSRLFNMRQVDQAVGLIRARGTEKERRVLVAAGYQPHGRHHRASA